jgi:hypothetical protein
MSFQHLRQKFERQYFDYDDELAANEEIFSGNTKCRFSIDFPMPRTCRPTPTCAPICYGADRSTPQAVTDTVHEKQLRRYNTFLRSSPDDLAAAIVARYRRKRLKCLRWCGVGDLFPEAVRVINIIAHRDPGVRQWVVTRKPEMARQLSRTAQNLYAMFSLDASPESMRRLAEIASERHPRIYFSFLCREQDTPLPIASVVFYTKPPLAVGPRACPADAGVIAKKNACITCGWRCATDAVLPPSAPR